MGARKPGSPGSAEQPFKPLRGECRMIPVPPLWTPVCIHYPQRHGAAGALGTRHSPRPLFDEGMVRDIDSGRARRPRDYARMPALNPQTIPADVPATGGRSLALCRR
jgi:hypothetical protein